MKKILVLFVAAVLLTAPAFAQSDSEMSGPNPALGSTPKAEEFAKEAAATDLFEIASSKLATQRGDDNVKAARIALIGINYFACVYRTLKHGRSGDEVRPGWRVN